MDSVHRCSQRLWISDPVNLERIKEQWQDAFKGIQNKQLRNRVSSDAYAEIKKLCGLQSMKCADQKAIDMKREINVPEGAQLQVLNAQKVNVERGNIPHHLLYRYINYPPNKLPENVITDVETSSDAVEDNEIVLSVQIFHPKKAITNYDKGIYPAVHFMVEQELLVLGSQYLTELRDKIDCVSDRAIRGEFSDSPDMHADIVCKDLIRSGFFYINGVFYNDMRYPDCRDYSESIRNWASEPSRGIGPFHSEKMESKKFIELDLQIGYPYVYKHQGDCEHLLVFSDIMLFNSKFHPKSINEYPCNLCIRRKKRLMCMTCNLFIADWVVTESKRLHEIPYFFCNTCFRDFNYDENDQKIGEFKAYHYTDRSYIV